MTRAMISGLIAGSLALVIVLISGLATAATVVTIPAAVAGLVVKLSRR